MRIAGFVAPVHSLLPLRSFPHGEVHLGGLLAAGRPTKLAGLLRLPGLLGLPGLPGLPGLVPSLGVAPALFCCDLRLFFGPPDIKLLLPLEGELREPRANSLSFANFASNLRASLSFRKK